MDIIRHQQAFNNFIAAATVGVALPPALMALYARRQETIGPEEKDNFTKVSCAMHEVSSGTEKKAILMNGNLDYPIKILMQVYQHSPAHSLNRFIKTFTWCIANWSDNLPKSFFNTPGIRDLMVFVKLPDALELWQSKQIPRTIQTAVSETPTFKSLL